MRLTILLPLALVVHAATACSESTDTMAVVEPAAAATGLTAPTGNYECWGNGQAHLMLNFTVTGPGAYTASDGSTGTFAIAPDGLVSFTGYEADVMPASFTIVYHVPNGRPTFSFRGNSGEAAFCEKV